MTRKQIWSIFWTGLLSGTLLWSALNYYFGGSYPIATVYALIGLTGILIARQKINSVKE